MPTKKSMTTVIMLGMGHTEWVKPYEKIDLSVPELFDVCIERCQTASVECIVRCDNDLICISECIVEVTACTDGEFPT